MQVLKSVTPAESRSLENLAQAVTAAALSWETTQHRALSWETMQHRSTVESPLPT